MGLSQLASRAILQFVRLAASNQHRQFRHAIVTTPELHTSAESAAAEAQPELDLPKRNPMGGARAHFPKRSSSGHFKKGDEVVGVGGDEGVVFGDEVAVAVEEEKRMALNQVVLDLGLETRKTLSFLELEPLAGDEGGLHYTPPPSLATCTSANF